MTPLEVVASLGSGTLVEKLHRAVELVSDEVLETQNPGTVTVTLKILPVPGSDVEVVVSEKVKRSPPESTPKGTTFFVLGGMLHDADPRQMRMDVDDSDGRTELRVMNGQAGSRFTVTSRSD